MHSPETGGPEMLMELAYRLAVEETPFIQKIRNNVIFVFTPVIEVDGREKMVDAFYYGKKTGKRAPPLMYWGKYVAHDNNRDGMGQALKLTQNIMTAYLDWHPTVLHDLHEAQSYLYASTGTGPYNPSLEDAFEAGGHKFGAGAFIVPDADRAKLEPSIRQLGLSAVAVSTAPSVKTHDLDVPRIGYVHTWRTTQDEGWVRLAFDTFKDRRRRSCRITGC